MSSLGKIESLFEQTRPSLDLQLESIGGRQRVPQESRGRELTKLLSLINDSALTLDSNYHVTHVNQVFLDLVKLKEADLVGKAFVDILDDTDILTISGPEMLFEDEEGQTTNVAFKTADGSDITLVTTGATLSGSYGEASEFIVMARDEREQQEIRARESRAAALEQERSQELAKLHAELKASSEREMQHARALLAQSEKLSQLGTLVAGIGHEMANPIMLIGVSLENNHEVLEELEAFLMPIFTGSEAAEEAGTIIREKLATLRQTTETAKAGSKNLRKLSTALRTQSRHETEATFAVDLNQVVKESIVLTTGRTKRHLVQESLGEVPQVTCFRSQIAQVITNLVSNAGDALTEKRDRLQAESGQHFHGEISVLTQREERDGVDGILISVSDNGDGVPEAIRNKIFDQFFTTKPAGRGTGLGLAMCIDIVRKHNGTLTAMVDDDLGGARFELWLPVTMDDEAACPSAAVI